MYPNVQFDDRACSSDWDAGDDAPRDASCAAPCFPRSQPDRQTASFLARTVCSNCPASLGAASASRAALCSPPATTRYQSPSGKGVPSTSPLAGSARQSCPSAPAPAGSKLPCRANQGRRDFRDFFPMTGRAPPIWKKLAGALASLVPIARKSANLSASPRGQEF